MSATVSRKLYIAALVMLSTLAFAIIFAAIALSLHDSLTFRALPRDYQSGITRLYAGRHYEGLSHAERDAILRMHKQWESEGRLPWWGAAEIVDPAQQRTEVLQNFAAFVPRWGGAAFQFHPIRCVLLSLLSLVPPALLFSSRHWLCWLLR